jgi:broad specificity phosphatase PhoE
MKIYLIRHAQSVLNVVNMQNRISGMDFNDLIVDSSSYPLTDVGQQQAQRLAKALSLTTIDQMYCSPFTRALQTAAILAKPLHCSPRMVDSLREVLPDQHAAVNSFATVRWHFMQSFLKMATPLPQRVTWKSELARARVAWEEITTTRAETVAAVSHAWLITLMVAALFGDSRWRVVSCDLNNCGVTLIESTSTPFFSAPVRA